MSEDALDPTALALSGNAVVAASAGTGKTHLLTNVYLALVLGLGPERRPLAAERIAATTFSRAAAREIRERLEQRLAVLAGEARVEGVVGRDPALERLMRAHDVGEREIQRRAARALEALPRSLIDTLHGLSTRIVRANAVELGLSPAFTILDESAAFEDAEATVDEVLAQALDEGGETALAARALIDACYGLEGARVALQNLLGLLDEEGIDADTLDRSPHREEAEALAERLLAVAQAVRASGHAHPLRAAADEVAWSLLAEPRDFAALEHGLAALLSDRRNKLEKYPVGRELVTLIDDELLSGKNRADCIALTVRFLRHANAVAVESRAIARLVARVQRTQRERRIARGALGFGDVLSLSRNALLERPELQADVASDLDALLVDEFQDTSRVQRDLLLLLRQEPEAARRRAPGTLPEIASLRRRGLLVVGDRKQSIYAFRGADVAVYARLAAELAGEPAACALDLRSVSAAKDPIATFCALTENFRSRPGILRFVNRVAEQDFASNPRRAFEIRYTDHEALVAGRGDQSPGRVTILEIDGPPPQTEDALLDGADSGLLTAFAVAAYCARARAAGTALSQIAVLARRRATLPLLELALDRFGVPFVVSGRALYATPEIRDLSALMRVALDPYDRHALVVVARSPLGGISDRALVELSEPGRGLLPVRRWDIDSVAEPSDRALVRELKERLVELSEVAPRLSPRDALAYAVECFELETVLGALPRGPGRFGNVGRLLEIAARQGGSLPRFSRWLERQIALEVDESEAAVFSEADDAVRLVTVHGSKGLAFDVTVLADADSPERAAAPPLSLLRHDDGSVELVVRHRGPDGAIPTKLLGRFTADARARAIAERQRLSYVALTRARHDLVIALPEKARADTLAASVRAVLDSGQFAFDPALTRLSSRELLTNVPSIESAPRPPLPAPLRPETPHWSGAAIGVTALSDFAICPRRFQLVHVLGIDEPATGPVRAERDDDARTLGSAAHRVLERFPLERWGRSVAADELLAELEREGLDREAPATRDTALGIAAFLQGAYAASLATPGTRVHRELELSVLLEPDKANAKQLDLFDRARERRALLKATLDLVVERADRSLEVIDYKRSRGGDSRRYALQLAAYESICRARFGAASVRVGLVHLLGRSSEPEWLVPAAPDLAGLVSDLVRRRYTGDYPAVPPARCRRARCGFLSACHPWSGSRPISQSG